MQPLEVINKQDKHESATINQQVNTSSQISNPRQTASKREITDLKKNWTSELIINENLCIWQEPLKPEN